MSEAGRKGSAAVLRPLARAIAAALLTCALVRQARPSTCGSLAVAESLLAAHRYAQAESVLALIPATNSESRGPECTDPSVLRAEARSFAPGPCDPGWIARCHELELHASDSAAPASERGRRWIAASQVLFRVGMLREAMADADSGLALLDRARGGSPRLEAMGRLAWAQANVEDAPLAAARMAHQADSLLRAAGGSGKVERPRALRILAHALIGADSIAASARAMTLGDSLLHSLPPDDPERGPHATIRGILAILAPNGEPPITTRRLAYDWCRVHLGATDDRTVLAAALFAQFLIGEASIHRSVDLLSEERDSLVARGLTHWAWASEIDLALARVYVQIGRFEAAERLDREAIAIDSTWHGPYDSEVRLGYMDLANTQLGRFLYRDAETSLRHAAAIGSWQDASARATILWDLAAALAGQGRTAEALADADSNLSLTEQEFGPQGPFVADSRSLQAACAAFDGNLRLADSLFDRERGGKADELQLLGADGADSETLARYDLWRGRLHDSAGRALACARASQSFVLESAPWLDDLDALALETQFGDALDIVLSAASRGSGHDPAVAADAWTAAVGARGMLLEQELRRARIARGSGTAGLADSAQAWHRELAEATLRAALSGDFGSGMAQRDSLRSLIRRAAAVTGGDAPPFEPSLTPSQASEHLPRGSRLVSYVRFDQVDWLAARFPVDPLRTPWYVAFVLADPDTTPRCVSLGPAGPIDEAVARWRQAVGAGDATARLRWGERLRRAIWDPLAFSLRGARKIMLVPDGSLNEVSFAALPAGPREFLADRPTVLHRLVRESDVLRPRPQEPGPLSALLVGDPDFDAPNEAEQLASADRSLPAWSASFGGKAGRLPATADEIQRVREALESGGAPGPRLRTLEGRAATEGAVKRLAVGCRVVHIATHGFYLDPAHGEGVAGEGNKMRSDALSYCGILLAGANNSRLARTEGHEDGWLTGEELSGMPLQNADWLVLSGCGSGLGPVAGHEGVFGLPRAARAAGVRTTIVSLWAVNDEATSAWMNALYRGRFVLGLSTDEAVWQASRSVLARLRALGRDPDPRDWAGFVAIGDWR